MSMFEHPDYRAGLNNQRSTSTNIYSPEYNKGVADRQFRESHPLFGKLPDSMPPRPMPRGVAPNYGAGSSYGAGSTSKSGGVLKTLAALLLIVAGYAVVHSGSDKKQASAPTAEAPVAADRSAKAPAASNSAPSNPTTESSADTKESNPPNPLVKTLEIGPDGHNAWWLPPASQSSSAPSGANAQPAADAQDQDHAERDRQTLAQQAVADMDRHVCIDYATQLEADWKQHNGAVSADDASITLESCKRSADADADPVSMLILGAMYEHGIGVPQDTQQAISWYRTAAQSKHSQVAEQAQKTLQRLGAQ